MYSILFAVQNTELVLLGDSNALFCSAGPFPLEPLLQRQSGSLSGGEQQVLALARALMPGPKVLMVDELSLGLAPLIVQRLLTSLRMLADDGLEVLMVEQHVEQALHIADRVVVLARGRVSFTGRASEEVIP